MTKFEEEVKRPANGPLAELNNNMQEVFSQYRKMRQYADYLEYDSKQKDERIQDFKNALNEASNELSRLSYENDSLKSQLQQQALPVVPECVGDYISGMKENGENITFAIMCSTYNVAGEGNAKAIHWKDSNPEVFARAWLDGFTVEKPQLFYLKNKITGMYLSSDGKDLYEHHKNHGFKFTQEDINSLDTGSYELVPVEDGE